MARQRRPVLGIGCLLLANELLSVGMNTIPPVTLLAVIGQTLLFLGIINPPWDRYDVCLSGESILYGKDYHKLFLSAVEHADDIHLYYNMASLILKGRSLERRYGSLKFLILLVVFTAATSLTYVGLVWGATEVFHTYSYMKQCAIGFSGVLFALKVLTTHYEGSGFRYVHGIMVPSKYAVWAELFVIHILVPRSSFIGHLAGTSHWMRLAKRVFYIQQAPSLYCIFVWTWLSYPVWFWVTHPQERMFWNKGQTIIKGILVGSAYVLGPLRLLVNAVHSTMSGMTALYKPSYTYTRSTVGPGPHQRPSPEYSRQHYGWNFDNGSHHQGEQYSQWNQPNEEGGNRAADPPLDEEEVRRRRTQRFQY